MSIADVRDTAALFRQLELGKYASLSGLVAAVFDYCITVDQEISLMWTSRWSFMKVLFLANRYSPFIDCALGFNISSALFDRIACSTKYKVLSHCAILGFIAAEGILMTRTYALWGCKKSLLVFFVVLSIGTYAPLIVLVERSLRSYVTYTSNPTTQYLTCVPLSAADSALWIPWLLLLIPETAVIALTVLHQYSSPGRSRRVHLFGILYRDGLLAYCTMLGTILLNVIVKVAGSPATSAVVQPCV
ncbi:hypothetical protein OBBRIDRAFT_833770 [Obba rivulosa]|uniref:DUF6533 domain-containing protein n=1 Tax=Obba rivulosa TaxID=1052685 RepID=A0A8E2B181_9APHY|nr:hypothetical protein OBBRIDRAFT_833770 [Obba rivulosa]